MTIHCSTISRQTALPSQSTTRQDIVGDICYEVLPQYEVSNKLRASNDPEGRINKRIWMIKMLITSKLSFMKIT